MAEQEKPKEQPKADEGQGYVGEKVKNKAREKGDAAARWPACETCGNEVNNTTYKEEVTGPTGTVLVKMLECGKCGMKRKLGDVPVGG